MVIDTEKIKKWIILIVSVLGWIITFGVNYGINKYKTKTLIEDVKEMKAVQQQTADNVDKMILIFEIKYGVKIE